MKKFEVIFAVVERSLYRATIEAETPEAALLLFDDTAYQVDWEDVEIIDREIDANSVKIEREKLPLPIGGNKIIQLPWTKWLKNKYMVQISDLDAIEKVGKSPNVRMVDVEGKLYLAYPDGEICQYTRGEAIKKARMFGGKIVKN
jgi:hypothetical protein